MALEEQAIKVLDESASDADSNLVDQLVEEFPALAGSLVKTINRRNKTNLEVPKKERVSKNKILLDITSNLSKINGELIIVNSRLQAQNDLLRGNLGFTASSIGNLEYNDNLLTSKLDSVLEALKIQNEFMREKEEDQKNDDIEGGAEHTEDTATSFGFNDVSKGKSNIVGKTFNLLKALLGGVIGAKLKALLGKFLLVPLLKKFAPGLVPLLKKGGIQGALRSILPKWLGGTGGAPKVKQLNLFEKGADVATSKPNILQRGAQWLNKQPLVKHTKDALTPHMKRIEPIIKNFTKDPIGGIRRFFSGKAKNEIGEAVVEKTTKKVVQRVAGGTVSKGMGAVPLVGNLWDLASAAYRFQQGDWVGGLLSLGSAVPVLGWGVAAVDIARDAGAFGGPPMERGGVIQAPPILTPAEKGAVIGGSESSDIGHIVNASQMILDTYGASLSGTANLLNDFPTDGSTGIVTLNPLMGSKPVREDEVKPEEKNSETKDIESKIDTSNTSDTLESNDTDTTTVGAIDSQTTSDVTSGLGVEDGDNIAFNWNKPSDNIEQLRYRSDHPEGTEQPNPFKEGSTLYKNFEKLRMYDKAGMTISSVSGVNNVDVSSVTPVTQTNNISDNISVNIDPTVRTKIVFVTRTISSDGNVVGGDESQRIHVEFKDNTKLSRKLLFV